jgi:hypothetical protein
MRPLVIALSAACLALALAACGGNDGAKSAGPAPSVPVETAPPATSPGGTKEPGTDYYAQLVEYVEQADAICKTATDKLEATLAALPEGADMSSAPLALTDLFSKIEEDALAQLRALPPPETAAVNPVSLCSHRGWSQDSGPTRAEFIAQANEICRAAESRWMSEIVEPAQTLPEASEATARIERWVLGWEATADIEEEALAKLRALPQPEADRALLEEGLYQVVDREIDVIRRWAAAASAGDYGRMWLDGPTEPIEGAFLQHLGSERVALTHQRDAFAAGYGLRWCPMGLPA